MEHFEELSIGITPLKPSTMLRYVMILSYFGLTKMRKLVKMKGNETKSYSIIKQFFLSEQKNGEYAVLQVVNKL